MTTEISVMYGSEKVKALKYYVYKPWRPKSFFNSKLCQTSYLALSASFEYICYGCTAIINIFTLTVRESILHVRIWRPQTSDSDV